MMPSRTFQGLPDPEFEDEFYADIPAKRAMAWVIDAIVTFLLTLVLLPFTAFTALIFYPVFWLIVSFLYRVVTIAGGSATLGMRLMSVELRNWRGERFSLIDAILHTGLYTLSFSFLIPQMISAALMLTTARAQGLHDLVLGTAAVNRSR